MSAPAAGLLNSSLTGSFRGLLGAQQRDGVLLARVQIAVEIVKRDLATFAAIELIEAQIQRHEELLHPQVMQFVTLLQKPADRKSVVSGRDGSVRVERGDGRHSNKKNRRR